MFHTLWTLQEVVDTLQQRFHNCIYADSGWRLTAEPVKV